MMEEHQQKQHVKKCQDDKFQIFEQWLIRNGAQFPLLELRAENDKSVSRADDDDIIKDDDDDDNYGSEEKKDSHSGESSSAEDDRGGEKGVGRQGVALMSLDHQHQHQQQHLESCSISMNKFKCINTNYPHHHHSPNNYNHQIHEQGKEIATATAAAAVVNKEEDEEDDGSKEMRGVHAITSIPPHTTIVSIPKSCLITVEMGQATPIGRKVLLSDIELDAPKHIFLMIYLLWDKKTHGSTSFFAPYYDILPKSLRNMPIFWNESELQYLQGSHMLTQIAERRLAIQQDYESICTLAPEFTSIATLREFQWARMIVCSRNFGLLINGHRTSALVPHADMLNHYRPRETRWTYCEESQSFTITTLQSIAQGAQVYDSYGQKCNHRFLLNYGFCVEKNVELDGFCPNEVLLELGMDLILEEEEEAVSGGSTDAAANTSGIVDGDSDRTFDRELWEKKLAFWSRGDATMSTDIFGAAINTSRGGSSVEGGVRARVSVNGLNFHSLASAVATGEVSRAGITTTSGSSTTLSLSWSTDIIKNVSSMNDPSTTSALNEALIGGGVGVSCGGLGRAVAPIDHPPSPPHRSMFPQKQIRVCVSHNENTRILFSMLRVLACNSSELDRITIGGRFNCGGPSSSSSGTSYGAQRLFGIPVSAMGAASSTSSSSTAASIRTCQDVRYPVSLRNERHAMELLLNVTSRALSKYPTSLSQDTTDLQDEVSYPKFSNKRNAKLQARGEKEVLHHYASWARTAIHVIDIICHELEIERKSFNGPSSASLLATVRRGSNDDVRSPWSALRTAATTAQDNEELAFDDLIHAMEDDDDCHTTILRYCSDVLGSVRRDELNRIATTYCSTRSESYRQDIERNRDTDKF